MGAKIKIIFFIIVVLGVGLYIYQSGIIGKGLAPFKSFFTISSSTRGSFSLYPNYSSGGSAGSGSGSGGGTAGGGAASAPAAPTSSAPAIDPSQIPPGFTASELSPYFHEVRFGTVSPGTFYYYGQISLYTYLSSPTTTVDITGWQIKANHGGEYLPQAIVYYDPWGLNAPSDIRVKSGDTVNLYSTSAPVNLRINKCVGYLPNQSQFTPRLPSNCPYDDRTGVQGLTGVCQNYIMSLGGCSTPDLSKIPPNDYSCVQYLQNHFNYHSCYNAHYADPDFLSNEVRVWMGSSPLDQYHDTVELFDKNGLLVDYYTY